MRALLAIAGLAVLSACQDTGAEGSPVAPEPELLISLVSGDDQVAIPGEVLPSPLVVQVSNVWGDAVAGVRVTWSVTSGFGAFGTSGVTVTGADGRAMASFTPSTARVDLRAAIEGHAGSNVLFRVRPRLAAVYDRLSPLNTCSQAVCELLVFYADHSFGLRYGSGGEFPGTYSRNGSLIALVFKEERWQATATVRGDSLIVKYNDLASLSDFEDGTFRLTQGEPPPP